MQRTRVCSADVTTRRNILGKPVESIRIERPAPGATSQNRAYAVAIVGRVGIGRHPFLVRCSPCSQSSSSTSPSTLTTKQCGDFSIWSRQDSSR